MLKSNRLIKDFRRQDRFSIWKHMEAMAVNYAVYSESKIGVEPYLTGKDVYVYANNENVVVVCLDSYKRHEQPTYAESEGMEPIVFCSGCDPRDSMVWKLNETMKIMEKRLNQCRYDLHVYGVLLTEATITNAEDLEEMWEKNHIKVFDGFKDLKHRRASVNSDIKLDGCTICRVALDSTLDDKIDMDGKPVERKYFMEEENEIDRLLDEFINGDMELLPAEDDILPDNEDASNEEEEDDASVSANDEATNNNLFHDDEIEQNQALSVKVKILRPTDNPSELLDTLVGCSDIKRRMDEMVALTHYNKMMHELFPNSKQHEVSLHSVFLGHPGTGKTTVCKIFGSLLHQAGALSKGHVVICDRGTFIGTLWGDEERSVRQVVNMAKGGVLMIDEAYLLNGKNDNDPGKLVIQLLMNILADETQRDIAVVLCGYKEPMMKLLDSNPGLLSRFPNKFEFADFTVDELLDITQRRIQDYGYQFTATAWEKYSDLLTQAYKIRNSETWGNARFVANQLERIYIQHATRCINQQPKDKKDLLILTPEDISPIEVPRQRTKIGF